MSRYRVYDEESARLLTSRTTPSDSLELVGAGEYLSANPGDVILAPSVKHDEVLYIRIKGAVSQPAPGEQLATPGPPVGSRTETATDVVEPRQAEPRHYVATGFLGLDGEVEEEIPEKPKPWWKRMFID